MTAVQDEPSPVVPAPHSEWRLARAAEQLLSSHDAAAYAVRDAVAGESPAAWRPGRDTAAGGSGDDAEPRPSADPAETPRGTSGPLYVTAGTVVTAVTGALSVAALASRLTGPGWVGALVTAGTGALAGMSAVIACARARVRSSAEARDRLPVPTPAGNAVPAGAEGESGSDVPGPYRRGGRSEHPFAVALVLTGATACVTIWALLLTGLVSARGAVTGGIALPELVAFLALPLAAGSRTARRRRPVRRLVRTLADRRATRSARRAHARARRLLLAHECAWHRVVLSAQTLTSAVPAPDRDAVHAALTTRPMGDGAAHPLPPGVSGALHSAVRLLRATDPAGLRHRLEGESDSAPPRSGAGGVGL